MYTILVIDDSKTLLRTIRSVLGPSYTVLPAISGEMGLRYLEKKPVDLILLDLLMPGMDGRETLRAIRSCPGCGDTPIIFLTAASNGRVEAQCLKLGACDFITKPVISEVLMCRINRTLELEDYRKNLQGRLKEKTLELENLSLQAITTIANTLDAKDEYTKGHSARVAEYSVLLARRCGWPEERCAKLHRIALLHDVGKIGVPDDILKKTGQLSPEIFEMVKRHASIGAHTLKDIKTMPYLEMGAECHHERYDGKGYPHGLQGDVIPEEARIISIADAYDAMTSDRCYRPRLTADKVRRELLAGAGKQFDPELITLFVEMVDIGEVAPAV